MDDFEIDLNPEALRLLGFLSALFCVILGAFLLGSYFSDPTMQSQGMVHIGSRDEAPRLKEVHPHE